VIYELHKAHVTLKQTNYFKNRFHSDFAKIRLCYRFKTVRNYYGDFTQLVPQNSPSSWN